MEVNSSESRREIELANRLLRDRDSDHARETENLRKAQAEQIEELSKNQNTVLSNVRAEAANTLTGTRDRFDDTLQDTAAKYERQLSTERNEAYDKFGRLATESNHDRAKAEQRKTEQIGQLIGSYEAQKAATDAEHKRVSMTAEKSYLADKDKTEVAFNRKLNMKDDVMRDLLKKEQAESGRAVREAMERATTMGKRDTNAAQSRYEKLLSESTITQDKMGREAQSRESQIRADNAINQQRERQQHTAAFDSYRERSTDALNSTIDSTNRERSATARFNEAALSKQRQQLETEKQQQSNRDRAIESDMAATNTLQKARFDLDKDLAEKRHREDMFRTENSIGDSNKLNADETKARYQERLEALQSTNKNNFERFQGQASNRDFAMETARNSFDNQKELEYHSSLNKEAAEHQRARNNLIREYDARQRGTEDTTMAQRAATEAATRADMKALRSKTDMDVSWANRDKAAGIYEANLNLRNRTDEQEAMRKMQLGDSEARYHNQAKRLNENYNRSLLSSKEAFDDEWNTYKYESGMQMLKARGDAEHEKRMSLLDLLQKNRAQMADMEAKFAEQKDTFDAELARTHNDSEKAVQGAMKRARETIETDRAQHSRELEAKDMAVKEKLRLQEEAFRDQIEKIRRSNDLTIKKG